VEKLLLLARADSGRENLQVTLLDLRSVIAETANEWRQLLESRDLQFAIAIEDCDFRVMADRRAVQRLLAILLDNAVKYTPPPGVVELQLNARNEMAVITVRDSGIGIAEQDQSRIFERFYRADKARSRALGGAGIGLAIASWIVQQHRGSIAVQSSIGNGSTFSVELPLQPRSAVLDRSHAVLGATR
jgi:signal transduction histidine kinase